MLFDWNVYQAALGKSIPDFARLSPDSLPVYQTLTATNSKTSLLGEKTRQLISLAVAVTTRCAGWITFHPDAALKAGESKAEIAEAVGVAMAMNASAGWATPFAHSLPSTLTPLGPDPLIGRSRRRFVRTLELSGNALAIPLGEGNEAQCYVRPQPGGGQGRKCLETLRALAAFKYDPNFPWGPKTEDREPLLAILPWFCPGQAQNLDLSFARGNCSARSQIAPLRTRTRLAPSALGFRPPPGAFTHPRRRAFEASALSPNEPLTLVQVNRAVPGMNG